MNDSASVAERLRDERSLDITPFLKRARQDIAADVVLYGRYPERGTAEILLDEFLLDEFYRDAPYRMVADLRNAVLSEPCDRLTRYDWEAAVEKWLEDSKRGQEIAYERAAEMARDSE